MIAKNEFEDAAMIPFVLSILFGLLKIFGVIDWSLLWILSPLWISLIIALVISVIGIVMTIADKRNKNNLFW